MANRVNHLGGVRLGLLAAGLAALAPLVACVPSGSEGGHEATLAALFPEHADHVLGVSAPARIAAAPQGPGFVPVATGAPLVAAQAAVARRAGLEARFPARGDGAVRLGLADGFALEVREEGGRGAGRIARGAVVYDHTGGAGASFWSAAAGGYEEWLLARPAADGVVARWEVRGGTLRPQGAAVQVLDVSGAVRLTVTAPAAYAASGVTVPVELAVRGERLILSVPGAPDPSGELLLVDPIWRATSASMQTPRSLHTATLLADGQVLIAGGRNASGALTAAELYDPATGTFTATGALATARSSHTATLLPSGKVLIAGGEDSAGTTLASAELYDPAAGTFSGTGAMATDRSSHTATLLPTGKVLVAGGCRTMYCTSTATAELYDPATGAFSGTGSLGTTRAYHTATLLPSGKVFIAGGKSASPTSSAELYDPAAGTFAAVANAMTTVRELHTATLLANGRVLIVGGHALGSTYLATAEIFNPANNTFAATGSLSATRARHTATLLPSGKVLIAGGSTDASTYFNTATLYDPSGGTFSTPDVFPSRRTQHTATLLPSGFVLLAGGVNVDSGTTYPPHGDLYDPTTGARTVTGSLATARTSHSATLLPSGKVLVAGGWSRTTAELYTPASGAFAAGGSLGAGRGAHTATLLPGGEVLLAAGCSDCTSPTNPTVNTAALYDPGAGSFTATGSLVGSRQSHTATLLSSGKVLIVGGYRYTGVTSYLATAEIYDRAAGSFTATGSLATGRTGHTATLLASGKVLVVGGYYYTTSTVYPKGGELYDPVAGSFSGSGALGTGRTYHTATLLPSGKVLVVGGEAAAGALGSAELYDPTNGTFSATGNLATARSRHTATLLPSGKVLIAGGCNGSYCGTSVTTTELYDPVSGTFVTSAVLATGRASHTATLLPTGKVLLAGGCNGSSCATPVGSAELFDEGRGASAAVAPTLNGPLAATPPGGTLALAGTRFTGIAEGGSGHARASAGNFPLLLLHRLDSEAQTYAVTSAWTPPPAPSPTATTATAVLPGTLLPGPYLAWVVANGVLSGGQPLVVTALANGVSCAASLSCASLHCVDQRCCDTACTANCQACDLAGHLGTCSPVPLGGEDENPGNCRAIDSKYCDGAGVCRNRGGDGTTCTVGGECVSTYCVDGYCCNSACTATCQSCDVTGSIGTCANVPAGGVDPTAAPTCVAPNACDGSGLCRRVTGQDCASNAECVSGNCVDGVCCNEACNGSCRYCNFPASKGTCVDVPDNQDPRAECQASTGGSPDCAGKCVSHQCAYPDQGTTCGLCSACDGTGRCTVVPPDDGTCGSIDCSALDTACRSYASVTSNRCAALGTCKPANDPATCTVFTELGCTDAGTVQLDGGTTPGGDGGGGGGDAGDGGGGGGGGGGCGCAAAPRSGGLAGLLVALLLLPRRRRRRPAA